MKSTDILVNHKLKKTSCREGILDAIMMEDNPLSENEIRERVKENYDRTTFYRSFKTLEQHKIIHKIVVDSQLVKYSLDNLITHKKEHVYFFCTKCHSVKCLDDIAVEQQKLPVGYIGERTEVLIKGICDSCNNKAR